MRDKPVFKFLFYDVARSNPQHHLCRFTLSDIQLPTVRLEKGHHHCKGDTLIPVDDGLRLRA